jgi:protein-tyrosine kinase
MSKFLKALEQAKRDQALKDRTPLETARRQDPPPAVDRATAPVQARPPMAEPFDGVDQHLVSLMAPAAFEAEQYRALRHIVEQLHKTAELKVIAVSSPSVGDGKTITAVNLAGALAQGPETKVLLVDADLRRSSLHHVLGLGDTNHPGLVDAIVDPSLTLDRIVQPRPPFNLSVICAGPTPPAPYEVLKSPRLGDLLGEARRQYDYVIVDTPPLAPVQDCRVIGRWMDGFLLVVAANRTPRQLVEEAVTTLDRAKIIGFVFNRDARSLSRRYFGYYRGYKAVGEFSSDDHGDGTLRRAFRRVGESFRHPRAASRSARRRSRARSR